MGGANYQKITPPHSLINVLDYSDPKSLGDRLKQLMKNDTEYLSYFWWKDFYVKDYASSAWCRLCQMLHDKELPTKVYDKLNNWTSAESHCKSYGLHPWSVYKRAKDELW